MLEIKPMAGALGAEISGIDLTQNLSTENSLRIRKLLNEYEVIFFRDQDISPAAHCALGLSIGTLQIDPGADTVEGFPELAIVESSPRNPHRHQAWHSDDSFCEQPPLGKVIKSVDVPPKGGDTLWASMTAAYDGLSFHMQKILEGLNAVHDFVHGLRENLADPETRAQLATSALANPPVRHPVIRTHPETGKKALFVNSLYTSHIEGMRTNESDALLKLLFEHIATAEYTCRFRWEPNCVAIWDNRSTQHRTVNDYFPALRRVDEVTIAGDKPY